MLVNRAFLCVSIYNRMGIKGDEPFLDEGSKAVLHIESLGQVVYAFINGKLAGT